MLENLDLMNAFRLGIVCLIVDGQAGECRRQKGFSYYSSMIVIKSLRVSSESGWSAGLIIRKY